MLLLDIIKFEARFIIPLSGMIISNAMNAASLTINRVSSEINSNRLAIETALSLGKNRRESSSTYRKHAVVAGMTSILNFLKTVGIVALPGAMTGMILAGVDPLEAVTLRYFTPYHQLKLEI
jgi:putative ABC transport system permease protein